MYFQSESYKRKDVEKGKKECYLLASKKPFSLASLMQAEIPFLSIFLRAADDTFRVIHLSSSGIKNFFT